MSQEHPEEAERNLRRAEAYRGYARDFLYPGDQERAAEHRRLFGALSLDCPPYETCYGASHVFQQAQALADISGFYRAFGLEPSETGHERADHISAELEFMAFLALKEAHALGQGLGEQARICREAQKKFLEDHLGRWTRAFSQGLQKKSPEIYGPLAASLQDLVRQECASLEAGPKEVGLSGFGPPEAYAPCFNCGPAEKNR